MNGIFLLSGDSDDFFVSMDLFELSNVVFDSAFEGEKYEVGRFTVNLLDYVLSVQNLQFPYWQNNRLYE